MNRRPVSLNPPDTTVPIRRRNMSTVSDSDTLPQQVLCQDSTPENKPFSKSKILVRTRMQLMVAAKQQNSLEITDKKLIEQPHTL